MITFHSLRHSFASWLALQGETLQTIGELLGHKGLTMTKRYSHLLPDHKRRATVALEKGFEESKKKSAKITTT
jgi:site-specific recombinase XerD